MSTQNATIGARRLTRGVTVTWWYTVSAVLFFQAMYLLVLSVVARLADVTPAGIVFLLISGGMWWLATIPLLWLYRQRTEEAPLANWRIVSAPLLVGVAFGVVCLIITGSWLLAVMPVLYLMMLLNWPPGVRVRVVLVVTLVLVLLWTLDRRIPIVSVEGPIFAVGWLCVVLPIMVVLSLWWWDVLITMDRALLSESRLAATQERLRVANDVHDLQGHHLQVIALQLELAERLIERAPEEALAQVRLARASVDEARQGTRDLAAKFRSAPLSDEVANAADLLRAAGSDVEVTLDPGVDAAPGGALGPIIRETTTNILRHGGGERVRISLTRTATTWRYEIVNDAASGVSAGDGSGLTGIRNRAAAAGGSVDVGFDGEDFRVMVQIPQEVSA